MPTHPRSSIPNDVTPDALRGLDSWALPPDGPLQIGATFLNGKYEIRGLLGTGGYAFVYDAHDAYLNVDVALKIIPNPPEPARAKQEARVGMRLMHPKIVKTLGGGVDDGLAYIVMEKLEGSNVRQAMAHFGRLTPVEMLIIAGQVAEAAAYAHGQGIVHRDLKPDNAFLTAGNNVCVLDFGIAKVVEGAALTTQKDIIHGTVSYISPEQIMGGSATVRSDIFALGTMMFEMIYGKAPVVIGLEEVTFASIANAQLRTIPPRLDKICPWTPRQVGRIVHQALAKKPEERFESMAQLAQYCFAAAKDAMNDAAARGLDVRPRDLWRPPPSSAREQPASTAPDTEERVMVFTTQRMAGVPTRSSSVSPSLGAAPGSAATEPLYRVGSELLNGGAASQARTARELPQAPSQRLQDRQRFVRALAWTAFGSTLVAFAAGGVLHALTGASASSLATPPAVSGASVPAASVPFAAPATAVGPALVVAPPEPAAATAEPPPITARPAKAATLSLPPHGTRLVGQPAATAPRPPSSSDEKQGAPAKTPEPHPAKVTIY